MTDAAGSADARELVDALVAAGGDHVLAVLLFGSRLVRASPDRFSAWDLVVVVDRYAPFHRSLVAGGHHRRRAGLLDVLARVLPPNVVAFIPRPDGPVGKCMILDERHFRRALSPRAKDHFLKGRMAQRVGVLHARDAEAAARVEEALERSRRDALRWAGPFVEAPFDAAGFAQRMLAVSYGGEIRPESGDRVREVFEVQRDFLVGSYGRILEEARAEGVVERAEGGYRFVVPPGPGDRLRLRLYFLHSKFRATARWVKHMLTFNDWLTYIQRKVERRTGMAVEITPLERRYPLIFLWPKVVRVLRARPAERTDGTGGDP